MERIVILCIIKQDTTVRTMQTIPFQENRREIFFLILATLYSVIVILSNLVTVKLISIPFFPSFLLPCGLLIYPFTFLISDLVTEIYGEQRARFMVYLGFAMVVISYLIIQLALKLPPHPEWSLAINPYKHPDASLYQTAFESVFGMHGLALLSSMCVYAVSQLLDIRLFGFIKELTKNKHLWLRNAGSMLTSQIVDTLAVNILLLYCGLKLDLCFVIKISVICYLYKTIFTLCNIPIFYLFVNSTQRFLGEKKPTLLCAQT